jgi:hypothetical protein
VGAVRLSYRRPRVAPRIPEKDRASSQSIQAVSRNILEWNATLIRGAEHSRSLKLLSVTRGRAESKTLICFRVPLHDVNIQVKYLR